MGREPEHHADRSAERRTDSFVERAELVGPAGDSMFVVTTVPSDALLGGIVVCSPIYLDKIKAYRAEVELARALAADGIASVRFDYQGFGNSDGDSTEVRLDDLVLDAAHAVTHLKDKIGALDIGFVGIRLGGLVAAAAARAINGAPLALWDAVFTSASYFREAMRARLIKDAGFVPRRLDHSDGLDHSDEGSSSANGKGESTGQLLADLAAGETIDVLGYPIHGEMYASIVEKMLVGAVGPSPRQILIVESGARGGARRVVRGAQEAWMADSFEVSLEAPPTEAWWFIGEALDAPAWVDPTVRWIRQAIASNSP